MNKLQRALLFLILFNLLPAVSSAQDQKLKFRHFNFEDGIPETTISKIVQDQNGFLWIGTWNGLFRYDGITFKGYWHHENDSTSLSANWIESILIDRQGNFIVSTLGGGLNLFDPSTETFRHYRHDDRDPASISSDFLSVLFEDSRGNIWVGTSEGLNRFNPDQGTFEKLPVVTSGQGGILGGQIRTITEDNEGMLWVGSGNSFNAYNHGGLTRFDPITNSFNSFVPDAADSFAVTNHIHAIYPLNDSILLCGSWRGKLYQFHKKDQVFSLREDLEPFNTADAARRNIGILSIVRGKSDDEIFIATFNGGLLRYNLGSGKITQYRSDPFDERSLKENRLFTIMQDREQQFWVGSFGGLMKFQLDDMLPFVAIDQDESVTGAVEMPDGTIWLSTSGNKIYRWDRTSNNFQVLSVPKNKCNNWQFAGASLASNGPDLWVVSSCGIYQFTVDNRKFSRLTHQVNNLLLTSDNPVRIIPVKDGIWMNCEPSPVGILANDSLVYFREGLNNPDVEFIRFDPQHNLWIGTADGLNKWDSSQGNLQSHHTLSDLGRTPAVLDMHLENDSTYWFATDTYGLVKYNPLTRTSEAFSVQHGVHSNSLFGLLRDKNSNFWLLNQNGISLFNSDRYRVRGFNESDGLVKLNYSQHCILELSTGEILIGGAGGFNIFNPDDYLPSDLEPQLVLQSILINGRAFHPGDTGTISSFRHNENDLSFEYSGILLSAPQEVRYQNKLENYELDFVSSSNRGFARYANLSPGTYHFQVKASNEAGAWTPEVTLFSFTIQTPWWKTWWFYLLVAVFSMVVFIQLRNYEIRRMRLADELVFKQKEARQLKELDQAKSNFFANISHEFRTPLTVIIGQVKNALDVLDHRTGKGLGAAYQNAQKLLNLVNELLDLAKLESGSLNLKVQPADLIPFLKSQFFSFESLADSKNVDMKFKSTITGCRVNFDERKMDSVLGNLIGNAIKFTPSGGTVSMQIEKGSDSTVNISIKDNGPGIAPEHLEKIFDRFYQVDQSSARSHEGTGIGLALTRELIKLHNGQIAVQSTKGSGAEFTVTLPVISWDQDPSQPEKIELESKPESAPAPETDQAYSNQGKPMVLVVEDNQDVREYTKSCLENTYEVLEADNGMKGIQLSRRFIPDLVISDVMMPGMDGHAFVRALREDEKTCHIPVIMLTAKAGEQDKIEGLKTGVDDFLTKPFNKQELLIRIENLLKIRAILRDRYAKEPVIRPADIQATSMDQAFLKKVLEYIEVHLGESNLGVDDIAQHVSMSESQLNRKLNAIIGKPPGQVLRSMRLQRAAALISQNADNISQIAYECGFNDLASFTRSFKKEFKVAPSKFADSKTRA